jgi:hypothetical protein
MSRKILISADWFAPGFRAGGPIRSVVNIAELLSDSADVRVLTSCRDLGVDQAYDGIAVNAWTAFHGKTQVFYGTGAGRRSELRRLLREERLGAVYLNSMFSFSGSLWPLWLARTLPDSTRIVLAPRGMLKSSALNRKAWKKRPLLKLLRWSGLMRRVVFHATSADELEEIEREFPGAKAVLIPNVPLKPLDQLPSRCAADGCSDCAWWDVCIQSRMCTGRLSVLPGFLVPVNSRLLVRRRIRRTQNAAGSWRWGCQRE